MGVVSCVIRIILVDAQGEVDGPQRFVLVVFCQGPRRGRRGRRGRGRRGQLQRLRGAGAVAVAGASAERGCFKSPWVRGRLALPQEPPIFAQAISLPSIWVSLSDGVLHSSPARDVVG